MKSAFANLAIAVVFILTLAVGGALGRNLTHLRESEAFYRWILAAATNERLFQDSEQEYRDDELITRIVPVAERDLPEIEVTQEAQGRNTNKLVRAAAHAEYENDLWNLARGVALAAERKDFLGFARDRKLQFAAGIAYADAQASGVNVFNLFFGFRKIAANLVWLEVDRYWHQGMMHRMIPLMKACVALDPNFVEAYLLGAWHMAYNATAKLPPTPPSALKWHPRFKVCLGEKELYYYLAADFLKGGIINNRQNYKLYFDLGLTVYDEKLKDHENAVKYLREAVRVPHDRWVPRMLYVCMERNGQYEEALAGWQDYQQRFPDSQSGTDTAPRFITRNKGLIFETRSKEARAAAAAATDPAVKAQKEKEAAENLAQAREIWKSMDEPFSAARLLVYDADDMAREGRYLEALGFLQKARFDSGEIWDIASAKIIEIKNEAGIPLNVSEKKAVLRTSEAGVDCYGKPKDAAAAPENS